MSEREEALRLGKDLSFIVAAFLANPGERPDLQPSAKIALKAWLDFEPNLARAQPQGDSTETILLREQIAHLRQRLLNPDKYENGDEQDADCKAAALLLQPQGEAMSALDGLGEWAEVLPPLPEPFVSSELEKEAYRAYGRACFDAGRAPLVEEIERLRKIVQQYRDDSDLATFRTRVRERWGLELDDVSEVLHEVDELRTQLEAIRTVVKEQAGDEGLWFVDAHTVPEAYLQQELRRLHAAIEGLAVVRAEKPMMERIKGEGPYQQNFSEPTEPWPWDKP